jgi:hypothetical protein
MNVPKFFKYTTVISIVALLALCSFIAFSPTGYIHKSPQANANVYFYETTDSGSNLIGESGNLITDIGEARLMAAMNGTSTTLGWIAVGNETAVAQTDAGLTTEATTVGFGRVACNASAQWQNSADYSQNFTASFDSTALIAVNSAILCWSATPSAADAFAMSFITDGTAHQFPTGSRLTVVWAITMNAN